MSKSYEFHFFKGKFDNEVKPAVFFTWEELCKKFSKHKLTSIKNDEGFVAAKFKTEDYQPATRGIYETIDGEKKEVGRETKYTSKGETIVGRYSSNIIEYNCLVLDYDGAGVSLQATIDKFKGFSQIGYTSHNHFITGVDKFRIILPFEVPCPREEFQARQEEFRTFAGVDDRSTTALARIFFSPTCPLAGLKHKRVWNETGTFLDWRIFPPKKVQPQAIISDVPTSKTGRGNVRFDTFDMVRFFKDNGMYVQANSGGKHDVRCFKEHEHATNKPGGTVVWQKTGEWPSFYCGHSHSLTSKNFWDYYKEKVGIEKLSEYCEREEIIETPRMAALKAKLRKLQEKR